MHVYLMIFAIICLLGAFYLKQINGMYDDEVEKEVNESDVPLTATSVSLLTNRSETLAEQSLTRLVRKKKIHKTPSSNPRRTTYTSKAERVRRAS